MAFETFDSRQKPLVEAALLFAKTKYGKVGLRLESPISDRIRWRPTFYLKSGLSLIIAFEYNDGVYPDALDGAIVDIMSFDYPIAVFQLCPLASFLGDKNQARTRLLIRKGIGIITIDEDTGTVALQKYCVPLAQNISEDELNERVSSLTAGVKLAFRNAHDSFTTNVGQGVQEAGQIIEAIIRQLHAHAVKQSLTKQMGPTAAAASLTDALYNISLYSSYRGVIGGVRQFIEDYRNLSSHPQRSGRDAIVKIKKCRTGFLHAIELANGLRRICKRESCRLRLHGL